MHRQLVSFRTCGGHIQTCLHNIYFKCTVVFRLPGQWPAIGFMVHVNIESLTPLKPSSRARTYCSFLVPRLLLFAVSVIFYMSVPKYSILRPDLTVGCHMKTCTYRSSDHWYNALHKYSPPLTFSTFCSVMTLFGIICHKSAHNIP